MSLKQQEHARDYPSLKDALARRMQYNNRLSLAVGPTVVYLSRSSEADIYTLFTATERLWQGYVDELCAVLESETTWEDVQARDIRAELLRAWFT